jgi:hypothetical protein
LVFFLLQVSKNIWFICSSSFLKTFGFLAPPEPNVFRKLEEQENQMFVESWRSKKTKCFRKLEEQENQIFLEGWRSK